MNKTIISSFLSGENEENQILGILKPLIKKYNIPEFKIKIIDNMVYLYFSKIPSGFLEAFKKLKEKFPKDLSFKKMTTRIDEFNNIK